MKTRYRKKSLFVSTFALGILIFTGCISADFRAAVEKGDTGKVIELINRGANLNTRGRVSYTSRETVLIVAIRNHHSDIVKILLDYGADPSLGDDPEEGGLDAFWYAVTEGDYESFRFVIQHANTESLPYYLGLSSSVGNIKYTDYLIKHGISINSDVGEGSTALHFAHDAKMAKYLIEHGALINKQNNIGNTPLHTARDKNIAYLLLQKGSNPYVKNNDGITPVELALKSRRIDVYNLLIKFQDIKKSKHGQMQIHK